MVCLGNYVSNYSNQVKKKDDKEVLDDIARAERVPSDWYRPERPHLRLYLRLLRQEARKRGL